jgi:predicted CXXCH cytochrome family protein
LKKLIVVLGVLVLAGFTYGQITGTLHDFSGQGWAGGQICLPCHTPHNSDLTVPDAPLWNHEVTAATFTVYNSPSLDASPLGQPSGSSKLCLSCHDGTVALDSFGGLTGTNFIAAAGLVGTDLSDDHPISFTYDAGLVSADGGLHPITASTSIGGTIESDLLRGGQMECSSCHDVHNKYGNSKLLMIDNAASALCLTCHNK